MSTEETLEHATTAVAEVADAASDAAGTSPDEVPGGLGLDPRLVEAVDAMGFSEPTPIQAAAIPALLEGTDVLGRARTGSGKTAAFGLPLLHRLRDGGRSVRALVLAPTRELALQVTGALRKYGKGLPVRVVTIYGGVPYQGQLDALRKGTDVVVGTPGRVLDLMDRGSLVLDDLEVLVLDEADEMLRMGFLEDMERVFEAAPPTRQVALFSASMPDEIKRVVDRYVPKAVEIQVEEQALTVSHIEQRWVRAPQRHKLDALVRILSGEPRGATLVFTRTRASCAEVADTLAKRGLSVDALHGDMGQSARERVLHRLRSEHLDVVIATDVAARGIDVVHLTHVINYDMPPDAESYVHRIGRTGRAGRKGVAISFITPSDRRKLRFLERHLDVDIAQMSVPSDADIARQQRNGILTLLADTLADDDLEAERSWIRGVVADDQVELSLEDLAAAAVRALAGIRGTTFEVDASDAPPTWARKRSREEQTEQLRQDFDGAPMVELFLPIGRNKGVRPGDLVGAIANEAGISGGVIGRITVLDRKSFVGLPEPVAQEVLAKLDRLEIRGNSVPVSMARPQGGGGGDRRPRKPGGGRKTWPSKGGGKGGFKTKRSHRKKQR